MNKSNEVYIDGTLKKEFTFDHERKGVKYYSSIISVHRISNVVDEIPIIASEKFGVSEFKEGDFISLNGEFRSCNWHYDDNKSRLKLFVHVKKICKSEPIPFNELNSINLTGFVCKKPIYRKTPLGKEITDIVISVNREYNASDYIPLILWGSLAKKAEKFEIGKKISIAGRIQSRSYQKKFVNEKVENRTAYEVSVSTMKEE